MARNQTSAQKRHAQSEKRRLRNKMVKTECRTYAKQFVALVEKKDKEGAEAKFRQLSRRLDSARGKGIIKANAASRKKSRMAHLFNKTFAEPSSENKA